MGTRRNVITLNGNKYDAVTGELIHSTTSHVAAKSPKSGGSVDGFKVSKKRPASSVKHNSRTAHKSKTLMRTVVKKPETKNKEDNSATISVPQFRNPSREKRAKSVDKSKLISRFNYSTDKTKKEVSHIEVASPPKEHPEQKQSSSSERPVLKSSIENNSNSLNKAMQQSKSHKNVKVKKSTRRHKVAKKLNISPKLLNVSLALFAVIIMGGYFAYNNVPNLAMKVATTRSGTPGSLPGYKPGGFALGGPIRYNPGQIQISYTSNTDDRSYTLTETKSEWNSDALLENHVASNDRNYQTFQDDEKTIYIYDGDVASWVDNGIWYELNGNKSLNTDQILRIANSL